MSKNSNTSRVYIYGLNVLRAGAALGIMFYHYFFIGPLQQAYSYDVFLPIGFWGEMGVDIFFLLSGFLILLSTTGRSWREFIAARFWRIYPMFVISSAFVLLLGLLLPGTDAKDLLTRWLGSLTLSTDALHLKPLSDIYWTLMVEVKFYVLVAVIMKLNVWKKYRHQLLLAWLTVSIVNTFHWQNEWVRIFLNTQYAGHFCLGIILYMFFVQKERSRNMWLEVPMSFMLIFHNVIGYTSWIRGIYPQLPYNDTEILLGLLVLIGFVLLCINTVRIEGRMYKYVTLFSQMSYTYYLIHADLGFNIRSQYYRRWIVLIPCLEAIVNEYVIMAIVVIIPFIAAYFIHRFVTTVTNKLTTLR